jgi:heme-degrading monooxygenase HmoA
MFVALYRWKLKRGKEDQFREAWSQVTRSIREKCGSLGSRVRMREAVEERLPTLLLTVSDDYLV